MDKKIKVVGKKNISVDYDKIRYLNKVDNKKKWLLKTLSIKEDIFIDERGVGTKAFNEIYTTLKSKAPVL